MHQSSKFQLSIINTPYTPRNQYHHYQPKSYPCNQHFIEQVQDAGFIPEWELWGRGAAGELDSKDEEA
jgi:hypothetical protein